MSFLIPSIFHIISDAVHRDVNIDLNLLLLSKELNKSNPQDIDEMNSNVENFQQHQSPFFFFTVVYRRVNHCDESLEDVLEPWRTHKQMKK